LIVVHKKRPSNAKKRPPRAKSLVQGNPLREGFTESKQIPRQNQQQKLAVSEKIL